MCEAGRIRHHLKNEIEDPRNTVVAVGFMAEDTLGRKIIDSEVQEVKIFDRMYAKKAQSVYINAYSGHADMNDLDHFVNATENVRTVILVHGEREQMEPFAKRIQKAHVDRTVLMPELGQMMSL